MSVPKFVQQARAWAAGNFGGASVPASHLTKPTCNYFVRVENGQKECGAPATHRLNKARPALFYCEPHAAEVRRKHDVRELQPHERGGQP